MIICLPKKVTLPEYKPGQNLSTFVEAILQDEKQKPQSEGVEILEFFVEWVLRFNT